MFSRLQVIDKEINPFVDTWEDEKIFPAHQVFKGLGNAGFLGVNKPPGKMIYSYSYICDVSKCSNIPFISVWTTKGFTTKCKDFKQKVFINLIHWPIYIIDKASMNK